MDLLLHKMSPSMEYGIVVQWLKKEGQAIRKGEPLLQVETDKAVVDVPAPADGTLRRIVQPKGAKVPVGTVLAHIE